MKTAKRIFVAMCAFAIFAAGMTACGGGGSTGGTTTPSNPAPTASLSANPTSIVAGASVTLTASCSNCTSASVTNNVDSTSLSLTISASTGTGNFSVKPSATTTYTLSVSGSGGSTTATAKVTVTQPAPTISFSASPSSISNGASAVLTWTTTNATSVAIDQLSGTTFGASGSVSVTPSATTKYTATATGTGGTITASASVAVTTPSVTLSASGPEIDNLLSPYTISDITTGLGSSPEITATGIQVGDTYTYADSDGSTGNSVVTTTDIANGYFGIAYVVNDVNDSNCPGGYNRGICSNYSPHPIKVEVSRNGSVIGTIYVPLITDLPTLALSPDGSAAYVALGHPGSVLKFSTSSGKQTGTLIGTNYLTVAVDNTTSDVIAGKVPVTGSTATSTIGSSATSTAFTMNDAFIGITAINGNGYVADPQSGKLIEFDLGTMQETKSVTANGSGAWSLDSNTVNGALYLALYMAETTTLQVYDANLNLVASLQLSGVTKLTNAYEYPSCTNCLTTGGWPLVFTDNGQIALLDIYDQKLIAATFSPSAKTITLAGTTSLAGNAIALGKDEKNGKAVVGYFNVYTGAPSFQSFVLPSLLPSYLASSSDLPNGFQPSGIAVSSDGSELYVDGINFADDTTNGFAKNAPAFYVLKNE